MKKGQEWSQEFDSYVSRAFLERKDGKVTIDLTRCTILITQEHFYDLMLEGKKIKRVTYEFWEKYRNIIKGTSKECMV